MLMHGQRSKIVCFLVFLLVFTGFLGGCAYASDSAAVDLVIVLDNSASMKVQNPHSDPNGYRYYAAATMLNMCESEKSRAAIIYFANNTDVQRLETETVIKPVSIALRKEDGSRNYAGQENRRHFTDMLIEQAIYGKPRGGTFMGKAILKAIELLDAGAADRGDNHPIILVLADGRTDEDDIDDLEKSVQQAEAKGYRIYPVLLKNSNNTDIDEDANLYYGQMATRTGVQKSYSLENPSDLPEIFSEIFASQIGSSLATAPQAIPLDEGGYKMNINIPNHSVLETNILMSLEGVQNVRLQDPDGLEASSSVVRTEIGNDKFLLYKIIRPSVTDDWSLLFDAKPAALDTVKVNVLFSYNIDLQGDVQCLGSQKFYKNSQVILSAQFMDGNTPSTDTDLYTHGITATAYIVKPGDEITESTPSVTLVSQGNRFKNTITPKDIGINRSGDYEIIFHAEGDGLIKDSARIPLHIDNRIPIPNMAAIPKSIDLEIDNPKQETISEPDTRSLSVKDYVIDPDGDPLTMHITCDDPSLILLRDVDSKALTATLVTTGKSGNTQIHISAEDSESAALASGIVIPISVTSIADELAKVYSPKITITTPQNADHVYEINGPVDFDVVIYETQNAPLYDIDHYTPSMDAIFVKGNTNTGQNISIPLKQEGARHWSGTLQLDTRAEYPIKATLYAGENPIALNSDDFAILTINSPPEAVYPYIEKTVYIDPIKWPLHQEATKPYDIALQDLFTDRNQYDTLTFACLPDGQDVCAVSLSDDTATLSFQEFIQAGEQQFTITAQDTCNATAEMRYKVVVISLRQKTLNQIRTYAYYILAGAAFVLLLHLLIKPRFKNMALDRFLNNNNYLAAVPLKEVKHKLRLNSYADFNMLKAVGLDQNTKVLKSIRLKPKRKYIQVLCKIKSIKGISDSMTITVGNNMFSNKHKKLRLYSNAEIRIENNKQSISWRLLINQNKKPRNSPSVKTVHKMYHKR